MPSSSLTRPPLSSVGSSASPSSGGGRQSVGSDTATLAEDGGKEGQPSLGVRIYTCMYIIYIHYRVLWDSYETWCTLRSNRFRLGVEFRTFYTFLLVGLAVHT